MKERKAVVITQPNYIPWKGYFDLINCADALVLLDNVQYTRRDWRNRNRIKGSEGIQMMTIPVRSKGNYRAAIYEIRVDGGRWVEKHKKKLIRSYGKAECFDEAWSMLGRAYDDCVNLEYLHDIDRCFIERICDFLDIRKPIYSALEFPRSSTDKTRRLIDICLQLGATHYITGPSAKTYLNEAMLESHGIRSRYFDYSCPVNHRDPGASGDNLSIVDLLFRTGRQAKKFLKPHCEQEAWDPGLDYHAGCMQPDVDQVASCT